MTLFYDSAMTDDSTTWKPRLSAKARLRWDAVEKQHMLVFPEAALLLNESATAILKLCDGERTVEHIVDALVQQFVGTDRTMIADEVLDLLTRLRTRGLLEV
jgi:coenzyme PQQ biosynthesis protein PqqD